MEKIKHEVDKLKDKYKYLFKQLMELQDDVDVLTQQNYQLSRDITELRNK